MSAAMTKFGGDEEGMDRMREFFTPAQVDQTLRNAVQTCWMMLPPEKRSVDEVEKQLRRMMERVLRDLREDADAFGLGGPKK